jgi:hypothetical protein
MAFQVSPGVQVKEIDLTNVVPAVSTSIGAIAGAFQWGPVGEIRTIGSEKELVEVFGKPDSNTYKYFMPAAQFLQYGNSLRVVRAETDNLNATNDGSGIKITNESDYEATSIPATAFAVAKYPGSLGNSLSVSFCTANSTAFSSWTYRGLFDSVPGTSSYAANRGGADDEMHIVVFDEDGLWTGEAGTVLETFAFVSQASDAKAEDGTNNFYADVLNNQSAYIWFGNHDNATYPEMGAAAANTTYTTSSGATTLPLSGGTDDNTPTVGELTTAYDLFGDAETLDVNLIIGGESPAGSDGVTHANSMIALAEGRKDCVVFISPRIADTVNNATAGLCAGTDNAADPWFSPAGLNRGQLLGVTKVAFNPKKADRDDLYKARVNPIVSFPGEGTVLFGDKTALAKPSAFDRINVRRLFITLEKAVSTASKFQLFEFNDEFTRAQFRNLVEPFLRDVKGRRGITDFLVVCDETNNTGQVIDSNQFVADIYIKPARSINFITLNFVATRTGVEFSEIVGQ